TRSLSQLFGAERFRLHLGPHANLREPEVGQVQRAIEVKPLDFVFPQQAEGVEVNRKNAPPAASGNGSLCSGSQSPSVRPFSCVPPPFWVRRLGCWHAMARVPQHCGARTRKT